MNKILKYPENSFAFNPVSELELLMAKSGDESNVLFEKDGQCGVMERSVIGEYIVFSFR